MIKTHTCRPKLLKTEEKTVYSIRGSYYVPVIPPYTQNGFSWKRNIIMKNKTKQFRHLIYPQEIAWGISVRMRRLTKCAYAAAACSYMKFEDFNRSLKPKT